MGFENKQAVEITSAPSELNDIAHPIKYQHVYQADNFHLHRKVLHINEFTSTKKDKSVMDQINLSLASVGAVSTEEFSNIKAEKYLNVRNYDGSFFKDKAIRQFPHVSWKCKTPYSISISSTCYKTSAALDDVLGKDEPREGKAKQSVLSECREYLANYQESCGTPRYVQYSYAALITTMAQAAARCLWALIYVIVNVVPVIQMFIFILRFVLDKAIDIRRTKDFQQALIKFAILAVQLLSVYVCLLFILDFIVLPIVQMTVSIVAKFITRK